MNHAEAASVETARHLGPVRLESGVRPGHVLCYFWAAFVSIGIFAFYGALLPFILNVNLHIPPGERGVVTGDLQFWQEVVSMLVLGIAGAASDRVGRRVIYVLGFLVMGLAYATCPFAGNYVQLLAYRMFFAVGVAMLAAMLQVVLTDYPIDEDRGKLAGIANFLSTLGTLLFLAILIRLPAVFSSAGLSDLWAGRASYLSIAGVCVVSAILMLGLRPGRAYRMAPKLPLWTLIRRGMAAARDPRIALAYGAAFNSRADLVIMTLFLALWAQNAALADGSSPAEAAQKQGMLFGIIQVSALLWAPVFGWLADRLDRVTTVILAIVLSIIGYGWMGLVDHPLHTSAIPAAVMLGIGQISAILAATVLAGQVAPGPIRGAVVGMLTFFGAFGILAISKVGGYAFDHWMPGAPFLIMTFANVALLVFALYVRVRTPGGSTTAL
jgi:MFS family permease